MENNAKNLAISMYIGYEIDHYPRLDISRLDSLNGIYADEDFRRNIINIVKSMDDITPDWSNSFDENIIFMKNGMKQKYPWISDNALNALEWLFSWSWR